MLRSFEDCRLLFVWRLTQVRADLPFIIVLQAVLACGIVYGLAFLLPNIDASSALYLSTGAPTLTILLTGLTIVPQELIQLKRSGGYDYMRTFPVPRLGFLAAEVSVWLVAQVPAIALSLVVAAARFHFTLRVNPLVVPIVLLVAATSAAVGYALALALSVNLAQSVTQFVSVGLLLFSPIDFPMSRLPGALQAVHQVLPVAAMADLLRWSLTGVNEQSLALGMGVVAAWCAAALLLCWWIAVRRV